MSIMSQNNHSLNIEFNDNNILTNLFGINDKNIQTLEKINNVKIQYRGNKVKIVGSKKSINETREELVSLFKEAKKGIEIDEDKIKETKSMITLENDSNEQMDLFFSNSILTDLSSGKPRLIFRLIICIKKGCNFLQPFLMQNSLKLDK